MFVILIFENCLSVVFVVLYKEHIIKIAKITLKKKKPALHLGRVQLSQDCEPQHGDSLLLTTKYSGVPATYLMDLQLGC